jgi:hypothetical protein
MKSKTMGQRVSAVQLHNGGVHATDKGVLTVDPDRLMAFYPMEEEEESSLYDEAKDTHNGEIKGAKRTPGIAGNALFFDEADYAQVPNHNELNFGFDDMTYCFYLRPESEGSVLQKRTSDGGYEIRFEDGRITAVFEDEDLGKEELVSDTTLSPDKEYFIAVVRDAGVGRLYINMNLKEETGAEYNLTNTSPLFIGDKEKDFRGVVDEVYLYDRALAEHELRSIHEMYTAPSQ